MQFETEMERMQDPIAQMIPLPLWNDPDIFSKQLSNDAITIMQTPKDGLLTYLTARSFDPLVRKDKDTIAEWVAMAVSHPMLDGDTLIQCAFQMGLSNHGLLMAAASLGCERVLNQWIISHEDDLTAMNEVDFAVFRRAAANGHLAFVDCLFDRFPQQILNMISANHFEAFRQAAGNGHLMMINRFIERLPNEVRNMIKAKNYAAFRVASIHGYLDVVDRMLNLMPNHTYDMISVNDFTPFRGAATQGHLALVDRFLTLLPEHQVLMIAAYDFDAFRGTANQGHHQVIHRFLSIPAVLSYAEGHDREYGAEFVRPFITAQLGALRAERQAYELENPYAVFTIADDIKAKCCFFMLRNLIRRHDSTCLDDMRFLLDIPSVKNLVHVALPTCQQNELLRLALGAGNLGAAELLITIPAVAQLAEQNDYYRGEVRDGLDLRALAHDRESSMRALTTGEAKRLQAAMTCYQPMLHSIGCINIIQELRQVLVNRYSAEPAMILRDNGKKMVLPMEWKAFQALGLNRAEKGRALKAYYQNKNHTAWRYLAKPNEWMDSQASYVNMNPKDHSQKWSTFEEYQPLIAMLYLASTDANIPPTDGYTMETRLEHFIDELAYIGRAHNWDESRVKKTLNGASQTDEDGFEVFEEYDDLKGDKPSCYSGVKRRLLQSVMGHRLLNVLTSDVIAEELRSFVRQYFKSTINASNQAELKTAYHDLIGENQYPNSFLKLKTLDIPPDEQSRFVDYLTEKYPEQFATDIGFKKQVEIAFKLKGPNDAHAIQLGYGGLTELLEATLPTNITSRSEFFSEERPSEPFSVNEKQTLGLR